MPIDTAILLAAGMGSRLRDVASSKPLCRVAGKALIDQALSGLAAAGIRRGVVVLGHEAEAVLTHLASAPQPVVIETTLVDPAQPNGVSALAGLALTGGAPALLAMCDHLVDPALYARVAAAGPRDGLTLGIDRRLGHPWVDPDDVTCVATEGEWIAAIGKGLEPHNAYDTGVFAVGPALRDALSGLAAPSLTEGVRHLAADRCAWTVDCSDLDWIDVDDPPALAHAERWLEKRATL